MITQKLIAIIGILMSTCFYLEAGELSPHNIEGDSDVFRDRSSRKPIKRSNIREFIRLLNRDGRYPIIASKNFRSRALLELEGKDITPATVINAILKLGPSKKIDGAYWVWVSPGNLHPLSNTQDSESVQYRVEALCDLAKRNDPAIFPKLFSAISNGHPAEIWWAIRMLYLNHLAVLGYAESVDQIVDPLIQWLNAGRLSSEAQMVLGATRNPKAVEFLSQRLKAAVLIEKPSWALALSYSNAMQAAETLAPFCKMGHPWAFRALSRMSDSVKLPRLKQIFGVLGPKLRLKHMNAFQKLKTELLVSNYLPLLDNPEALVRANVARFLAPLRHAGVAQRVRQCLKEKVWEPSPALLGILAYDGGTESLQLLERCLKRSDLPEYGVTLFRFSHALGAKALPFLKQAQKRAQAEGQNQNPQHLPFVRSINRCAASVSHADSCSIIATGLQSPSRAIRLNAIQRLAVVRDEAAWPYLKAILDGLPSDFQSIKMIFRCVSLGRHPQVATALRDWALSSDPAKRLAVAALLPQDFLSDFKPALFKDEITAIRRASIKGLAGYFRRSNSPDTFWENAIFSLLNDSSSYVRREAVAVVIQIKSARIIPHLQKLLEVEDLPIQLMALKGLGRSGDPRVFEMLLPFLEHADQSIRQEAYHAMARLKTIGTKVQAAQAMKLLDHKYLILRARAARVLGFLHWLDAKNILKSALETDPEHAVREAAMLSFAAMADHKDGPLLRSILASGKEEDKPSAFWALQILLRGINDEFKEEKTQIVADLKAFQAARKKSSEPIPPPVSMDDF